MITRDDLIKRGVNPVEVIGRAENLKLLADEAAACGDRIVKMLEEMAGRVVGGDGSSGQNGGGK